VASVRQSCTRLGAAALVSLFASLVALLFLFEARPIVAWFVASAALTILSFGAAAIAALLEERNRS